MNELSTQSQNRKRQVQYSRKHRSGSTNDLNFHQATAYICIKIQMNENEMMKMNEYEMI